MRRSTRVAARRRTMMSRRPAMRSWMVTTRIAAVCPIRDRAATRVRDRVRAARSKDRAEVAANRRRVVASRLRSRRAARARVMAATREIGISRRRMRRLVALLDLCLHILALFFADYWQHFERCLALWCHGAFAQSEEGGADSCHWLAGGECCCLR